MHDVSGHLPIVLSGEQRRFIGVQSIHRFEFIFADSHNDDRQRQVRASDDLVDCLLHVVDNAVGNDQQNVIFLVVLRDFCGLAAAVDFRNDGAEVRWAVQTYLLNRVHVGLQHSFKAVAFGLEDISIESKAMSRATRQWLNGRSESVGRDLLV